MCRTKKWPGLDAPTEEYTDLFGPYDERIDVRGLDRLIGEGVIELPDECRDPLDLIIQAEDEGIASLTYEEFGFLEERDPFTVLVEDARIERVTKLFSTWQGPRSKTTWHAVGYTRGAGVALRRIPDRRRRAEFEHLRDAYRR